MKKVYLMDAAIDGLLGFFINVYQVILIGLVLGIVYQMIGVFLSGKDTWFPEESNNNRVWKIVGLLVIIAVIGFAKTQIIQSVKELSLGL